MKQPKLKLEKGFARNFGWMVDAIENSKTSHWRDPFTIGYGKSEKTALRGAIRNLKKLLAEAEKRLEELE